MDLKVLSSSVAAIGTLAASMYGGMQWLETNYASAGDLKAIELRLEQKILTDQLRDVEHRIWTTKERYGPKIEQPSNVHVREELKRLQDERDDIEQQLDKIRERAMKHRFKE